MTPDTKVRLGSFVFRSFEVPEQAPFGGDQSLAVHKLIGGGRVIDAMGRDDAEITWSAAFLSVIGDVQSADERARSLDTLRISGQALSLSWDEHSYLVVIKSFKPVFHRYYYVPYTISLTIVNDQTSPVSVDNANLANTINDQANNSLNLATSLDLPDVLSAVNDVQKAVGLVSSVTGGAIPGVQKLQGALGFASAGVGVLVTNGDNLLGGAAGLGSIAAGIGAGQGVATLTSIGQAAQQLPNAVMLQNQLGTLSKNLGLSAL